MDQLPVSTKDRGKNPTVDLWSKNLIFAGLMFVFSITLMSTYLMPARERILVLQALMNLELSRASSVYQVETGTSGVIISG